MSYRKIKKAAFSYLCLPLLVFLLGYLKWYFGIPLAAAVVYAWFCAVRKTNVLPERSQEVPISRGMLIGLGALILLWTYLGGLNGHFYQTSDWGCRNAVYHDLIDYPWAVRYPNGNALNYYIGFWLVPALPAKLAMLLTGSRDVAWEIARNALWLWTAAGLYLTVLLLIVHNRATAKGQQLLCFIFFVFFSGLDLLGILHYHRFDLLSPSVLHLEWWAGGNQFSSITTCLYWVFNQTVLSWLAVICFLFEKDERNYLLIGMACFACGPLPFVGLVIYMTARALINLVRNIRARKPGDSLRAIFSPANLLLVFMVFPVIGLFFLNNSAVAANANRTSEMMPALLNIRNLKVLIAFCGAEVGIYCFLLWKRHLKDPLFYFVAVSLLIIPNIYVGSSADFCMRASVPGIFILSVWFSEYCLEQLWQWKRSKTLDKICCTALLIAFLFGAVTPCVEIYRGLYRVVSNKTIELEDTSVGTFANSDGPSNFLALDCGDRPFYRYFAR